MEERSKVVQIGGTSKYSKIPVDFWRFHNVKRGDYFVWSYDENSATAFLRLFKAKKQESGGDEQEAKT
jgi:hypothetical protein